MLTYSKPFPEGTKYTKPDKHMLGFLSNNATDFLVQEGTPVLCVDDYMQVFKIINDKRGGWTITLLDLDNFNLIDFCHLNGDSIRVKESDFVGNGVQIAESGNTGTSTTEPHLHVNVLNKFLENIEVKFE